MNTSLPHLNQNHKKDKQTHYDHAINNFYDLYNKIFSQNVLDKIMDDFMISKE